MDSIKRNLGKLAIGSITAIALGVGIYYYQQKQVTPQEVPKQVVQKEHNDESWPIARRIIDPDASDQEQHKQLEDWMNNVLGKFVKQHGNFKVDKESNLLEEDFMKIYDLIEAVGRFELYTLREKNELAREKMFLDAFIAEQSVEARNQLYVQYVTKIYEDIEQEIGLYQAVQDKILKKVQINEIVWNQSMDVYLPSGESYVLRAINFSMSSPFKFNGKQTSDQMTQIYKCASDFALELLKNEGSSFNEILIQQTEVDDEQDKLIILDYLVIDHVRNKHKLNSKDFKSAISAYDLTLDKEFKQQIQKIVQSFCQ